MRRPHPLFPLVQDLLTLGPDRAWPELRVDSPPSSAAVQGRLLDRFAACLPNDQLARGRTFTPQDPLGPIPIRPHPDDQRAATLHDVAAALARLLHLSAVTLFPTKAAALQAALATILRPGDAIILDTTLFSAMSETVLTLQAHPLRSPAALTAGVERRLRRLAATRHRGRIWVVVPALSAHASTMAELADLITLCQHHRAGLIVDVSQDLGLVGLGGGGVLEVQGCLGRVDVVLGGLGPTFGATGGFVASRDPELAHRMGQTTAQDPVKARAAPLLAALDLITSVEGQRRRCRLHALGLRLRNHLMADGVPVLGHASPIVPVRLLPHTALAATALMHSAGVGLRLLQAPDVARHAPRWCLHLAASHSPADIDSLAELIRDVTRAVARRR